MDSYGVCHIKHDAFDAGIAPWRSPVLPPGYAEPFIVPVVRHMCCVVVPPGHGQPARRCANNIRGDRRRNGNLCCATHRAREAHARAWFQRGVGT